MTRVGVQRLEMASHDTFLRREKMTVGVSEMAHSSFRRIVGYQVGEDPSDARQAQRSGHLVGKFLVRIGQQIDRISGGFLIGDNWFKIYFFKFK